MNSYLTIEMLKQNLETGILIFDKDYQITCFNKTVHDMFQIGLDDESLFNLDLSIIHPPKAFLKIKQLTQQAIKNPKGGSHLIKIYKQNNKELIIISKVLVLYGKCNNLFIALLHDITNILTNSENSIVKIPVYDTDNFLLLTIEDIEYFKATGNYTEVFYKNKFHLSPLRLGEIEKRLISNQFLRSHKSFIVNLKHIKNLKKIDNKYFIVTESQQHIPVSRNRIELLLKFIGLR